MTQPTTKQDLQHMPLPWVMDKHGNVWQLKNRMVHLSGFVTHSPGEHREEWEVKESEANAAFIVQACNSFYAMRDALELLLNRYTGLVNCGDCGHWDPEQEHEVIESRKALALANGEQAK